MNNYATLQSATAEAMSAFIGRLPCNRQARVSLVCGAIVEAGDLSGGLNRQFREEQAHALALAMKAGR